MTDCIFCKIIKGEMDAQIVYKDKDCVAFYDINPQAPKHILIVPRRHIATLNDISEDDRYLAGHLVHVAQQIAKDQGIADDGYRVLMNCNAHGGQEVYHIHLHLLGGRQMNWPPG